LAQAIKQHFQAGAAVFLNHHQLKDLVAAAAAQQY
jgi:hypothetical protein